MELAMYRPRFFILICALIAFCEADHVFADSPSVTAVLSNSDVAVGEAVQLQIRVSGAGEAKPPENIAVDGLEVQSTGTSRQFEMRNFNVTSSVTYNYTILPLKSGTFKIPPQTVRIGSSSLRTPELTLNVAGSPNSSARSAPSSRTVADKIAFAELVVPKKTAYVGEMIPAEVRLGFDPRTHPKLEDGPTIAGQGFTTQKWQQPRENLETIGGKSYDVLTFKTAIAAARPGTFEVGPVEAKAQVLVPQRPSTPRTRPRSPFDVFEMEDPFSDPFFSDPFGAFGRRMETLLKSEPVTIDVKPLPPNAPPSFSGAVGNFTMNVEAKPKEVQVGDPITLTSTIAGRGNFDRMNAPGIEDEHGWHKYPPSSKFSQDDDVGISGSKTFEMVLTPNERKQAVPSMVFSYFDPLKENYVTLRSNAIPVRVEGGALAAATPPGSTTAATASSGTPAAAAARPSPKSQDILYQLTERGRVQSFAPIYAQPVFWMAQIFPLAAMLGFVGLKIRQAKVDNREAQRIAALQHEAAELMRTLRRNDVSPEEYFSQASRAVRVKTALASRSGGIDPNVVDAETAAATFELDEKETAQLRRLFERTDELRYSGAHNGEEAISPESRRQVLELIENLRA
jgi:BatD DUF11 like domain